MIRLTQTATTSLDRATAFSHVGDFGNIDQWDPGVASVTKASAGDVAVGTVYHLTVIYNGRELAMKYRVTGYEPDRRIVIEGSGPWIKAIDVIDFAEHDDGTMVTYTADLSLKGIGRLLEPLTRKRFEKVGQDAGEGLRRWLGQLEEASRQSS